MTPKLIFFLLILFQFVEYDAYSQRSIFESIQEITNPNEKSLYFDDDGKFKNVNKVKFLLREFINVGDTINEAYLDNPFLGSKVSNLRNDIKLNADANLGNLQTSSSFLSIPVTTLADGLSKFFVKRTKEELSIAFFNDFKDVLNNDTTGLSILFPSSAKSLEAIDQDIYRFNLYLNTLRESFAKDMKSLPYNMSVLLRNKDFKDVFNINSDQIELIADILQATQRLVNGNSLQETISFLGESSALRSDTIENVKDFRAMLQIAQLVSESLLSSNTNQTWVSPKEINDFIKDEIAVEIYLGLLWQKGGNIEFNSESFRNVLKKLYHGNDNMRNPKNYLLDLYNVAQSAQQLDDLVKNIRRDEDKNKEGYELYYDFIVIAFELIEGFMNFGDEGKLEIIIEELQVFKSLLELPVDVKRKEYASAIVNLTRTIDYFFKDQKANCEISSVILKYGTFIAEIANADEADEISNIIENAVLPAGSASIKKNTKFNISLNAYVGGRGSFGSAPNSNYFSVNAPVGVAFSVPLKKSSISAYFSPLDIGAVTALRFVNDTISVPEITLENIIAPAMHLVYGFPKAPASIGVGYQWGPSLRAIKDGDLELSPRTGQFSIFLAVDLPLFNIYSSGQKFKKSKCKISASSKSKGKTKKKT